MASENKGPGFGTGLILGGIIGALVGLLLAPRPGEETRAQVMESTAGLRHRAEERTAGFRQKAEELTAEARERLREVIEEGRAVASRIRPGQEGNHPDDGFLDNRQETPS